ncbi:hypothetical protein QEH59_17590 [Coraliomargarita sp. SDUM461004]|uniref:Peptidase C39 domain-containing protein n=1 Tax=Thalassobacterium sedimentorum TaxID=3041258 RepID=A0ABU1ANF7_9BACT|nr:hypothetical protein [Coraliomargarita sp. SDUM461004]MDQ8196252.1 hypothetical protein [Coraliomargarita sp. SDUM461004]
MIKLNVSLLVIATLCAVKLFATVNFEDFYDIDDFSKHCGTHAVLVCLAERGLGDLESFDAVDEFLDPDGDGTTTFLRIIECLETRGVSAIGYRGSISDLSAGGIFILEIKLRGQPHFSYAWITADSGEAVIFDPALSDKSLTVSLHDLTKVWSGNFIEIVALSIGGSDA